MRALALLADEAEELHRTGTGGAEPVRGACVELSIVTAEEPERTLTGPGRRELALRDVVVRATRR